MHRTADDLTATPDGSEAHEPLSYSVPAAAKIVGLSERTMWDKVKFNEIESYRDGGRRLISRRALKAYVAAKEANEAARSAAA